MILLLLLIFLFPTTTTTTSSSSNSNLVLSFQSINEVPRIKASDFDTTNYYQKGVETPLIIETGLDCEYLCDTLMDKIGKKIITLQQKTPQWTKFYDCTVDQAIKPIMIQSNHKKSLFAFCEGLLNDDDGDETTTTTTTTDNKNSFEGGKTSSSYAEQLTGKVVFENDSDNQQQLQRQDWFDYFPSRYQPSDCVILAGEGATSTLHRDPFEWTGTSLCLEGTKLWRFIAPKYDDDDDDNNKEKESNNNNNIVDELLKAYRLPSMAWEVEDDNNNDGGNKNDNNNGGGDSGTPPLSAGWQSDFSLYTKRCDSVPSALSLSQIDSETERYEILDSIASDPKLLHSEDDSILEDCSCWTVVQKPGDLLLIPAHWWHQTYALEPSLAVASQRCDSRRDTARVINHILTTTGTIDEAPDILVQRDYSEYVKKDDILQVIDTLFDYLDRSKRLSS